MFPTMLKGQWKGPVFTFHGYHTERIEFEKDIWSQLQCKIIFFCGLYKQDVAENPAISEEESLMPHVVPL